MNFFTNFQLELNADFWHQGRPQAPLPRNLFGFHRKICGIQEKSKPESHKTFSLLEILANHLGGLLPPTSLNVGSKMATGLSILKSR